MTVAMIGSASSEVAFPQSAALDSVARNASDAFPTGLMAVRTKPAWVREVCDRLDCLGELPANWDSYGAAPPDPASIKVAKLLLHEIGKVVGVERPDVGLSPAGNVALSWELAGGKRNLNVEILGTGKFRFAYWNEGDESEDCEATTRNPNDIATILTQW